MRSIPVLLSSVNGECAQWIFQLLFFVVVSTDLQLDSCPETVALGTSYFPSGPCVWQAQVRCLSRQRTTGPMGLLGDSGVFRQSLVTVPPAENRVMDLLGDDFVYQACWRVCWVRPRIQNMRQSTEFGMLSTCFWPPTLAVLWCSSRGDNGCPPFLSSPGVSPRSCVGVWCKVRTWNVDIFSLPSFWPPVRCRGVTAELWTLWEMTSDGSF